ncbi:ComF family protein [Mediterraneibacter agrestimuris]|uniref:ComF family protein n=1 Tax=Mediterraneibacter agrestimuris TaxID=2941333 RepID=UPI00203DAAEB|nr:ComF family protein [Mediterraneibacter agrestimuris]
MLYPPRCPFCGEIITENRGIKNTAAAQSNKMRYRRGTQKDRHCICTECNQTLPYIGEQRCMKCGKPVPMEEQEYCTDCAKHKLAFEQGRSLWIHTGSVMQAVYRFKFHNKRYYAHIFAQEMAEYYGDWVQMNRIETIIPVPLHFSKRRSRGFNQAELLANEFGKLTGLSVETNAVVRIKKTSPQKKLSHEERQTNLKGAFGVRTDWKPARTVLLVDDIYTTGNTIHRIAKVLKKAGVQKVFFLTISIGQGL